LEKRHVARSVLDLDLTLRIDDGAAMQELPVHIRTCGDSPEQLAGAQPCASAPALVGPQWPLAPQASSAAHEVGVHGGIQWLPSPEQPTGVITRHTCPPVQSVST
jgi:hypothetical protein